MPVVKELELNKRYTWEDIIEAYPDMWVYMSEPVYNEDRDLISGILLAVCDFKNREDICANLYAQGKKFISRRTTDSGLGVFYGI